MAEQREQGQRKYDRKWWKDPRFILALILPPLLSFGAAWFASNRALELKQASLDATQQNLTNQFSVMRQDFTNQMNNLSARIDGRLGEIGYAKAVAEQNQREITAMHHDLTEYINMVNAWGSRISRIEAEQKKEKKP